MSESAVCCVVWGVADGDAEFGIEALEDGAGEEAGVLDDRRGKEVGVFEVRGGEEVGILEERGGEVSDDTELGVWGWEDDTEVGGTSVEGGGLAEVVDAGGKMH